MSTVQPNLYRAAAARLPPWVTCRLTGEGYRLFIGPSERDSSARISLRPGAANLEGRMVNDTVGVLGRESVACIFQ